MPLAANIRSITEPNPSPPAHAVAGPSEAALTGVVASSLLPPVSDNELTEKDEKKLGQNNDKLVRLAIFMSLSGTA